jgi:hypothetical protein
MRWAGKMTKNLTCPSSSSLLIHDLVFKHLGDDALVQAATIEPGVIVRIG